MFGAYRKFNPSGGGTSEYCNKLVYMCSFWLLIGSYSCVFVIIVLLSSLACYFNIKSDGSKKQLPYNIQPN